jgi:hypothetical protein
VNIPFAIAFGLCGIALMIGGFILWREEDNLAAGVMVGIPGLALVSACLATLTGVGA